MLSRGINSPLTTSVGRLFDAVAALIGLHQRVTFEGQAAMALEFVAESGVDTAYPLSLVGDGDSLVLDWRPLVEAVLHDLRRRVAPGVVAARFHNWLVTAILAVSQAVGERHVALTGGCFQNRLLTEQAGRRLTENRHLVLLHRQVPPNDGGISFGQVVVAAGQMAGA
jgi:hydrogenase maturation protein HypF